MKKSTLLSLLTATSIVLTSAGTYALWDTTSDTSTSKALNFRKPVTITVSANSLDTKKGVFEAEPVAEGNVKFTVANTEQLAKKITLTPSVSEGGVDLNKFEIDIKDPITKQSLDKEGNNFVDTKVKDATTYNADYEVTITAKDTSVSNQAVKIDLTATLSAS